MHAQGALAMFMCGYAFKESKEKTVMTYHSMPSIGRWRIPSLSSMLSALTGHLPCRAKIVQTLWCSLHRCRDDPRSRGRLDLPSSLALSVRIPLVRVDSELCCDVCSSDCRVCGLKKSIIFLCECLLLSGLFKRPSLCLHSSSKNSPRHLWSSYLMTLASGPKPSLNR